MGVVRRREESALPRRADRGRVRRSAPPFEAGEGRKAGAEGGEDIDRPIEGRAKRRQRSISSGGRRSGTAWPREPKWSLQEPPAAEGTPQQVPAAATNHRSPGWKGSWRRQAGRSQRRRRRLD